MTLTIENLKIKLNNCIKKELDGCDWTWLLREQPQFAEYCDWEKLNGWNWSRLLSEQPQFADKCNWEKLDGRDWSCLLRDQPQFEKFRDKEKELGLLLSSTEFSAKKAVYQEILDYINQSEDNQHENV